MKQSVARKTDLGNLMGSDIRILTGSQRQIIMRYNAIGLEERRSHGRCFGKGCHFPITRIGGIKNIATYGIAGDMVAETLKGDALYV